MIFKKESMFFTKRKKSLFGFLKIFILFLMISAIFIAVYFLIFNGEKENIVYKNEKAVEKEVKTVLKINLNNLKVDKNKINKLFEKGIYNVKKIEDISIMSEEGPEDETSLYNVMLDIYYPNIVENKISQKWPLVIITHPTVSLNMAPARKQFDYLSTHLVSHGYIVAIYEWSDNMGQCEVFRNAMRETNIVNYLNNLNQNFYSPLYNLIDINKIALVGHSNGAFMQYFAKTEDRVKAVVSLAGIMCEWGGFYSDLADLKKPFMYIGATYDQMRANTKRMLLYGLWEKHYGPKIMFDVYNGDHWQFTDKYKYYPDVIQDYSENDSIFKNLLDICEEELSDGNKKNDKHCNRELIPREVQHMLVKHFVLAFFEAYLKNDFEFISFLKSHGDQDQLITNYQAENLDVVNVEY